MPRTKKGRRIALLSDAVLVALLAVFVWVSWERILFLVEFESLGKNAQGCPEYRHRETGIVMVKVPGGTFMMGTPEFQREAALRDYKSRPPPSASGVTVDMFKGWLDYEQPQHEVTLSAFLIAKYEVSQAEWLRIMESNGFLSFPKGEDLPVEMTSWNECFDFCKKVGLSLPTEAQWEYACRAGSESSFAFGDRIHKTQAQFDTHGLKFGNMVEVQSKEPNPFGIHNMHGNIAEWCLDYFDGDFYRQPEATLENPMNASPALLPNPFGIPNMRSLRGGSFHMRDYFCRSSSRSANPQDYKCVGFRPAWSWP